MFSEHNNAHWTLFTCSSSAGCIQDVVIAPVLQHTKLVQGMCFPSSSVFSKLEVTTIFNYRYCSELHGTWLINSAAHKFGYRPYNPYISPVESLVVRFLFVSIFQISNHFQINIDPFGGVAFIVCENSTGDENAVNDAIYFENVKRYDYWMKPRSRLMLTSYHFWAWLRGIMCKTCNFCVASVSIFSRVHFSAGSFCDGWRWP